MNNVFLPTYILMNHLLHNCVSLVCDAKLGVTSVRKNASLIIGMTTYPFWECGFVSGSSIGLSCL